MPVNYTKRYGYILKKTMELARIYCETHPSYELDEYYNLLLLHYDDICEFAKANYDRFTLLTGYLLRQKCHYGSDEKFAPPCDLFHNYLYDYMITTERLLVTENPENKEEDF